MQISRRKFPINFVSCIFYLPKWRQHLYKQLISEGFPTTDVIVVVRVCLTFSSVQLLSCVQLFATPWIAARQASLSITNSWRLLKLVSIESVMPSNHLILCYPLLLPSIFPRIRVFSLVTHKLWLYSHGHCNDLSLLIFQVSVFSSVKLK